MTQARESVITDEMRAAVGIEGPPVTLEVEKTNCRMFARSVGHTDPIYYDEAAAKARGFRSIVAPPGFLGTPIFNPGSRGGAPAEDAILVDTTHLTPEETLEILLKEARARLKGPT